jgi:short-subunit dehydrogenase
VNLPSRTVDARRVEHVGSRSEGASLSEFFRERIAVVTGAASGIGRALACALATRGARLALADRDRNGLSEVADVCRRRGAEARTFLADLGTPGEPTAVAHRLLNEYGGVDVLVNNAGIAYYGPTDRMPAGTWETVLRVNLHAPIELTTALLPTLLERFGAVVNMCSVAGLVGGPRSAIYHASKFGLVGFSESLRAEYSRRGLRVVAVCPGPVRTNLFRQALHPEGRTCPTPPKWASATPEAVAAATLRAVERNRRLTVVTPLAHSLWTLKRFMPWTLDWMNRVSRKNWRRTKPDERRAA